MMTTSNTRMDLADGRIRLTCPFDYKDLARGLGGRWNTAGMGWDYPLSQAAVDQLKEAFPGIWLAPEVEAWLADRINRSDAAAELKAAGWADAVPLEPMPLKTPPFQHQVLAYNIGLQLPAAALLMEQGTGKSLTAVALAGRRYLRGEIAQVLVVAPASVVPVWPREFKQHGAFPVQVLALAGSTQGKVKSLAAFKARGALAVVANNYESVWRMETELAAWIKARPTLIICDESQRIKTVSAAQSKALHRLAKLAPFRLILSGTPICNSPLDVFSQYKFLDPAVFGQYIGPFRARYAVEIPLTTQAGQGYKKLVGYRNLDELKAKAHSIAFRCTKAECLDLPDQVDQVLYCDLEPAAARIYDQLVKDSVAELDRGGEVVASNVLSKLLRLAQVAGGYLGVDGDVSNVSKAKLNLLAETLEDLLGAGKKVVIFARFTPEIAAIRSALEKAGIGYRMITGQVPLADRGQIVEEFQTDPAVKVFLAQIQCAGLGITLTAADTAIFYSLDFSFANYDQARARIHRISQVNRCTYIHLVARGTVDEKTLKALQDKRDLAADVVDRWRELLGGGACDNEDL